MSQNIEQIFTTNPASSMISTDLLYLGRDPYGASDDFAITWSNLQASITEVGTIATGVWHGTVVGILYGGTGVASVTTAPTSSSWAGWDVNSNISANNFLGGFVSIVTAAGTTVLTVASKEIQEFTGSTTQTVTLPVTSTLVTGFNFRIINNSSGAVTVNSSGGNAVQVMAANTYLIVTCVSTSGTTAASWNATYIADTGPGLAFVSVAGTTQTAVANTMYALNNAGATTVTLPTTASSTLGDTIKIKGASAASWIIQAAAGQTIKNGATSSSVAGTATSNAGTDSLQLVYVAANIWSVDFALSAGITLA